MTETRIAAHMGAEHLYLNIYVFKYVSISVLTAEHLFDFGVDNCEIKI